MKRLVYGSIAVIALMAASSAMAEVTSASLTTKGYVDAGLEYVYGVASGAATAAATAQQTASTAASNASAAQAAAEAAQTAAEAAAVEYVGGTNVSITEGATGTANEGKMVVSVDVVSDWANNTPSWVPNP